MGRRWEEETDGAVRLKIYGGGTQGSEGDVLRKMRVGQVHAAALSPVGLRDLSERGSQVFHLPLLFESDADLGRGLEVVSTALDPVIRKYGCEVLAWVNLGWARPFTRGRELRHPSQASGFKALSFVGDPAFARMWQAAGFNPVQLAATDVVPGLETDLVNLVVVSPVGARGLQWYRQAPFMTDLPVAAEVGALVVTTRVWDKVPAGYRARLAGIARETAARVSAAQQGLERAAIEEMVQGGLQVVSLTEEEREAWRTLARGTWSSFVDEQGPHAEILEQVRAALAHPDSPGPLPDHAPRFEDLEGSADRTPPSPVPGPVTLDLAVVAPDEVPADRVEAIRDATGGRVSLEVWPVPTVERRGVRVPSRAPPALREGGLDLALLEDVHLGAVAGTTVLGLPLLFADAAEARAVRRAGRDDWQARFDAAGLDLIAFVGGTDRWLWLQAIDGVGAELATRPIVDLDGGRGFRLLARSASLQVVSPGPASGPTRPGDLARDVAAARVDAIVGTPARLATIEGLEQQGGGAVLPLGHPPSALVARRGLLADLTDRDREAVRRGLLALAADLEQRRERTQAEALGALAAAGVAVLPDPAAHPRHAELREMVRFAYEDGVGVWYDGALLDATLDARGRVRAERALRATRAGGLPAEEPGFLGRSLESLGALASAGTGLLLAFFALSVVLLLARRRAVGR